MSSDYHWKQHVLSSRNEGVTEDQVSAVAVGDTHNSAWSPKDKALIRFLDETISGPTASEDTFEGAREYFNDQEMVEITVTQVTIYSFLSLPALSPGAGA
jgi:alkylhydroperoxidase family enzyme